MDCDLDDLERIAIKLTLAHDVYPNTAAGRARAEADAKAEAAAEQRRRQGSAAYEQAKMFA